MYKRQHLESSSLDYHGQSVELTKNELKILYYLFKNGGKICSRADMIEYLWDNQLYVDDNALSVNINLSLIHIWMQDVTFMEFIQVFPLLGLAAYIVLVLMVISGIYRAASRRIRRDIIVEVLKRCV